jgi:hypothetical protein
MILCCECLPVLENPWPLVGKAPSGFKEADLKLLSMIYAKQRRRRRIQNVNHAKINS